jgi:class 3 adenylate cyclase
VDCPRCGAATLPGQKFCAECGYALGQRCPNCGTPYDGEPKFCAECGTALAHVPQSEPGPPRSERRFVSVLFADLVGYTGLSEQQDPEQMRDLLSRYFDTARQVIEGYGGTVEKFIGDAVMAIWGAPTAHEDDAERAVRAALELVQSVSELTLAGQPLSLRAGVFSGEAAVTPGRVGEGMVAGDVVNTASRLQSVAPPGTVLVGEQTRNTTSAAIAYEPAGEQLLKGKQASVAAWRALRVVARVGGEGRDEGLEPPFVGRRVELRLLKDQLHATEEERKLRTVLITGQAGMGKSRLVWELEKYLDGLAGPVYYWHQGRSPSYGEGVTFWALGEMVRRRARIAEGEDEASTREKLRATLAEFVPDEDERRRLEPALGALLGIDDIDWDAREQLFSAWRTFFERIADRGPSVLVFEDLQWADSGLFDFIDHLAEWSRDGPILIVGLARPELLQRRPDIAAGRSAFVALHLEPLSEDAMAALLRGLVPAIPDKDLARIVGRAEGVPLYAVETVRSLVDGGHLVRSGDIYELVGEVPSLDVPPSLRALIASRLDALPEADRRLLQDAAVIGLTFAVPPLAALQQLATGEVESSLRALGQKELVALETDPRSPERGQYRFRQELVR